MIRDVQPRSGSRSRILILPSRIPDLHHRFQHPQNTPLWDTPLPLGCRRWSSGKWAGRQEWEPADFHAPGSPGSCRESLQLPQGWAKQKRSVCISAPVIIPFWFLHSFYHWFTKYCHNVIQSLWLKQDSTCIPPYSTHDPLVKTRLHLHTTWSMSHWL